ncbi:Uncharacterised protein [uncultured archaeon]|nr:Uncharacterised protein [uncultured archaeon]
MITVTYDGYIIALISACLSLMSGLVRRAVLDIDKIKLNKEKLKAHQQAIKDASKAGDKKKLNHAQSQMMELTMESMKDNMKPMLFTIIPFMVIFGWLKQNYDGVGVVATLLGMQFGWFAWYFITSIVISLPINKILKLT